MTGNAFENARLSLKKTPGSASGGSQPQTPAKSKPVKPPRKAPASVVSAEQQLWTSDSEELSEMQDDSFMDSPPTVTPGKGGGNPSPPRLRPGVPCPLTDLWLIEQPVVTVSAAGQYTGSALAATISQLKECINKEDPVEEYKVNRKLFIFIFLHFSYHWYKR